MCFITQGVEAYQLLRLIWLAVDADPANSSHSRYSAAIWCAGDGQEDCTMPVAVTGYLARSKEGADLQHHRRYGSVYLSGSGRQILCQPSGNYGEKKGCCRNSQYLMNGDVGGEGYVWVTVRQGVMCYEITDMHAYEVMLEAFGDR